MCSSDLWPQVLDDNWTVVDRLSTPSWVHLLRPRGAQESKAEESANAEGGEFGVMARQICVAVMRRRKFLTREPEAPSWQPRDVKAMII